MVESGGNPNAIGDGGDAAGLYQIHREYWKDGCRILGVNWDYRKNVHNPVRARIIVLAYLKYYGEKYRETTGHAPTMEVLARIHQGGPDGWKDPDTLKYWRKVHSAAKGKL
jgi:hypothetical protein